MSHEDQKFINPQIPQEEAVEPADSETSESLAQRVEYILREDEENNEEMSHFEQLVKRLGETEGQ
jgi:hypothetical protein